MPHHAHSIDRWDDATRRNGPHRLDGRFDFGVSHGSHLWPIRLPHLFCALLTPRRRPACLPSQK